MASYRDSIELSPRYPFWFQLVPCFYHLMRSEYETALRAANQIGDDAIQSRTRGKVTPHAFTHGTSEQRMRWFMRGLESGRIEDGDTFEMPYEQL